MTTGVRGTAAAEQDPPNNALVSNTNHETEIPYLGSQFFLLHLAPPAIDSCPTALETFLNEIPLLKFPPAQ